MTLQIEDFYPINKWEINGFGSYFENGAPMHTFDRSITDLALRTWSQKNPSATEWEMVEAKKRIHWTYHLPNSREYLNESSVTLGIKCTGIFLGGLVVHPIAMVGMMIFRLGRCLVLLLAAFVAMALRIETAQKYVEKNMPLLTTDLANTILSPLLCVGLMLIPLYGMISPLMAVLSQPASRLWTKDLLGTRVRDLLNDSRKLYATFERAAYGMSVIAPCFQPREHFKPIVPNFFRGFQAHLFGGDSKTQNAW